MPPRVNSWLVSKPVSLQVLGDRLEKWLPKNAVGGERNES